MIRAKLLLCGVGFALAASSAPVPVAKTVVGVINWDCSLPSDTWFGHYATTALSPAAFRHATPYYADVKGPDRIDYHGRSVEEYEREMQYAIDAGVDYFAYCWYGEQKEKGGPSVAVMGDRRLPAEGAEGVQALSDYSVSVAGEGSAHAKIVAKAIGGAVRAVCDGRGTSRGGEGPG